MSVPVTVPNPGRAMLLEREPIRMLDVDPDLGAALATERRARAERAPVVSTCCLQLRALGGVANGRGWRRGGRPRGGQLLRELIVADHLSAELLGARACPPPATGGSYRLLPADAQWSVCPS